MKEVLKSFLIMSMLVLSITICGCDSGKEQEACINHQYSEDIILRAPTCSQDGEGYKICNTCGETKNFLIDKLGHSLEFLEVIETATCGHSGSIKHKCKNCDYTEVEVVSKLNHSLSEKFTNEICDYKFCKTCGKKYADMPIIEINTENNCEIIDEEYVNSTISVSNCEIEYALEDVVAEVKVRGNGTALQPKKPFRIKFNKKQKMLGLNNDLKAKSWVLLAEYADKSFVRNMSAFYMSQQLLGEDGYYVSDFKLVEVYINGNYNGIYLLAEQQQVNSDRIDITEPEEDSAETNIGYLLEMDSYAKTEDYYFQLDYKNSLIAYDEEEFDVGLFNNLYTIKSDIYSDIQAVFIKDYMQKLYDVIYDAVYADHSEGNYKTIDEDGKIMIDESIINAKDCISKLIDLQSLIDTYILNEIVENVDFGWSSFYMSIDFGDSGNKLLTFDAPWDFDWSMVGNLENVDWYYACTRHKDYYTASDVMNPWLMIFCNQEWFWELVKSRWADYRDSGAIENTCRLIEMVCDIYELNFEQNFEMWPNCLSYGGYNHMNFIECKTQKASATLIKQYIILRTQFLDDWWEYSK